MKVYATHCEIFDDTTNTLIATVKAMDDVVVSVDIKQVVGWKDWYELTDAVRKAMVMMEIQQ